MLNRKIFSVSQVNHYIKNILDKDYLLSSMWVMGEISNYKSHPSGHLYFTLKDGQATINCVMFKGYAKNMPFYLQNGMRVNVCGSVSMYEKTGVCQLYAELIEPIGTGAMHLAFEQLKEKLAKEGLFLPEHKKPIPPYPEKIAVITSSSGAALRDIIHVCKRRNKQVKVIVCPTLVQGLGAQDEIVKAITRAYTHSGADILIVARGGGSLEDLWAFNDEKVARAIYASPIPVITGIGHETDYTIADFVADVRAATPSAAVEMAVPLYSDICGFIEKSRSKLHKTMYNRMEKEKKNWRYLYTKGLSKGLWQYIANREIQLEEIKKDILSNTKHRMSYFWYQYQNNVVKLEASSPLGALKKGFSITYYNDAPVRKAGDIQPGDTIKIQFNDGFAEAVVTKTGEKYAQEKD